ncbi:hypothetical protein EKO04_005518 [Ascochyta lentis]|uniref:Uncharacterized protein n=1 Tax=Ascochyta lentis TaxID=205686 RepID=A0A8H7J1P8_9PLEO|nr:hypothetical protein EKO04_005518 [Ascochyta lentis]
MSRKRTPKTSTTLPTPAPENISNREYYHASETTDTSPHSDELMDFPAPSRAPSPSKEQQTQQQQQQQQQQDGSGEASNVQSAEHEGFVELSTPRTPSPSPSDIVAGCALQDARALADLERRTRGLERGERKRRLLGLQEERRRVREGERRGEEEEVDAEYDEVQRRGREEV